MDTPRAAASCDRSAQPSTVTGDAPEALKEPSIMLSARRAREEEDTVLEIAETEVQALEPELLYSMAPVPSMPHATQAVAPE
jgi:hypothetical protein